MIYKCKNEEWRKKRTSRELCLVNKTVEPKQGSSLFSKSWDHLVILVSLGVGGGFFRGGDVQTKSTRHYPTPRNGIW